MSLRLSSPTCLRFGLAVLAGTTWGLSFPTVHASSLAWIAPALLLTLAFGPTPSHMLRWVYLAGCINGLISLHWLLFIPFPTGAVAGWLALAAYTALYPVLWIWVCLRLLPPPRSDAAFRPSSTPTRVCSLPPPTPQPPDLTAAGSGTSPSVTSTRSWLAPLASHSWGVRTLWCLAAAAAWIALEWTRGWLFTGFPWNPLGVSQYRVLPIIQIASLTGVYGVSFLVVWTSVALLLTTARLFDRFQARRELATARPWRTASRPGLPPFAPTQGAWRLSLRTSMLADLALPLITLVLLTVWGTQRLVAPPPSPRELRVALIQPSIPQRLIFDPAESTHRFQALLELTRLALAARPDLLVWPEASLPDLDASQFQTLTNLIATHRVWMIFGADDVEPAPGSAGEGTYHYYNSAFLFDPQGRYGATYRKQQLVIFGEYIPFEHTLPFVKHLTPIQGSFSRGPGPVPFVLREPSAHLGILICFEDVFPHVTRRSVQPETDFLLNLTNNGWFGESAAQWQHAANAVFRAVENGLPLVRCTNNGLTCWIDALGRIRDVNLDRDTDIYGAGFRTARIPLLPDGQTRPPTLYRQAGDWFAQLAFTLVLATLGSTVGRRRRPVSTPLPPLSPPEALR